MTVTRKCGHIETIFCQSAVEEADAIVRAGLRDCHECAERDRAARNALVKCACGHTVPGTRTMSTSRGTSCPACYDQMSE